MTVQTKTLKIGDTELTVFNDGHFVLPSAYFGNVPETLPLSEEVGIGANLWTIRKGDYLILVDTGSAEALKARFPETGEAWSDLQGLHPTDIVLTHMHADHLGGFLDGSAFPEARIHVARAEWDFWTNPALVDSVPEDMRPMVEMIQMVARGIADRVQLHDGTGELAPGVEFVALPGHTPGHSGLRIGADVQSLLIVGDAVISEALQFAAPDVSYALDGDAALAAKTRRAMLSACAKDGTTIAATHFSFPGLGKVEADGDSYRFLPL